MNRTQNVAIENKALICPVWGEIGEKKRGPKMKVYPVMLMKTKDRFFTIFAYPVNFNKTSSLTLNSRDATEKKGR
jgi:hypothetical protein